MLVITHIIFYINNFYSTYTGFLVSFKKKMTNDRPASMKHSFINTAFYDPTNIESDHFHV